MYKVKYRGSTLFIGQLREALLYLADNTDPYMPAAAIADAGWKLEPARFRGFMAQALYGSDYQEDFTA